MKNTLPELTPGGITENLQRAGDKLPSVPKIAQQLVQILASDDVDLPDIVNIIKHDVAIVSRLLRVANSPLYKRVKNIGTIEEAVTVIGLTKTCNVALAIDLHRSLSRKYPKEFDINYFWRRAILAAIAAKSLAGSEPASGQAFIGGLLQDIGVFILALSDEQKYMSLVGSIQTCHFELMAFEKKAYFMDHSMVGAHLVNSWDFPPGLVRAVLYSHVTSIPLTPLESAVATSGWIADYLLGDSYSIRDSDVYAKSVLQCTGSFSMHQLDIAFKKAVAECEMMGSALSRGLFSDVEIDALRQRLRILQALWDFRSER